MQESGSSSDGSVSGNMKNLKDSLLSGRNGRAGEIFLTESSSYLVKKATKGMVLSALFHSARVICQREKKRTVSQGLYFCMKKKTLKLFWRAYN